MKKTELITSILGCFFILALIIYSATSSGFTMFLHLILLISGLFISILTINKITKSKNSLMSKIYSSLIISLLIFFAIIFFWFLGNHSSIDEKGLTTAIIIIPTSLFFSLVSFITGLVLSIKRKTREDFEYILKPLIWISSATLLILVVLFFYNPMVVSLAESTTEKNLCHITLSPNLNSYLFNAEIERNCLLVIITEESKTGEITCSELVNTKDRNSCYRWTSQNKRDIKICINNVVSETEILKYNEHCTSAIRYLEDDIYTILKDPQHQDILYALRSVHYSLGICYGDEQKYIPLLKEIVKTGSLESKKEALDILMKGAYCLEGDLEGEKNFLREQILPLIENQPELKEYVTKINQRLKAVVLQPSTSTIRTE